MARQRLGAFARLRKKRDEKLAKKQKAAEKTVVAKEAAVEVAAAPANEVAAELVVAREKATAAENKAINAEAAGPKLVSPAKIEKLKRAVRVSAKVVKQLEVKAEALPLPAASPVVASDPGVALTAFDWALILLSAAADELKISKWYAIGGAAVLGGLYYLADKQGWLDFINF